MDGIGRASAGGLAASAGVVALGVTIVLSGNAATPAAPNPSTAPSATFEPKKVTLVATRSIYPWKRSWSGTQTVRLRASDPGAIAKTAIGAKTWLASGDGHQMTARLKDSAVAGNYVTTKVLVDNIPLGGEYAGTLSVDPLSDKAAALELTVKARHPWFWPLLVLLAGIGLGVGGTKLIEARRRRQLLRLALVEVGSWLQFAPRPPGLYDLPAKLVGNDPGKQLFPTSSECKHSQPTLDIPRLYCSIGGITRETTLTARTKEVEQLLIKVEGWYRTGLAFESLRVAHARLPDDDAVQVSVGTQSKALLDGLAEDPGRAKAEDALAKLAAQAQVVETFLDSWQLWVAADKPDDLDPTKAYDEQPSAGQRTAEESLKLVGRLRELEAALRGRAPQPRHMFAEASPLGGATQLSMLTNTMATDRPWDVPESGGVGLGSHIRKNVRAWDTAMFVTHGLIAALAFFVPVYTATSFGSFHQYLSLFAAGFLGKVAIDQAGPMRSMRLTPSGAPVAAASAGDAEAGGLVAADPAGD